MMKKLFLTLILSLGFSVAQVPTPQPQPATAVYSTAVLTLLPTYDRGSYEATFGVQAAPFDSTRATKTWFDSSATTAKTYTMYDGNLGFNNITLPMSEASTVNLKGLPHFNVFVPATSNVTLACNLPTCLHVPYAGIYQSTFAQAQAIAKEIGSNQPITERVGAMAPASPFSFTKNDPSNPVSIYFLGNNNVGLLLSQRNSTGVGTPGVWNTNSAGYYVFAPTPLNDGSSSTAAAIPVPSRLLLPNEAFKTDTSTIFPTVQVVRTDLVSTSPNSGTGGGFTPADRAMLQQIIQLLTGGK
jgi:hypothetical protein